MFDRPRLFLGVVPKDDSTLFSFHNFHGKEIGLGLAYLRAGVRR